MQREILLQAYCLNYFYLSSYLYEEDNEFIYQTRGIFLCELTNILHAIYSSFKLNESYVSDFTRNVFQFLDFFCLHKEKRILIEIAKKLYKEIGSHGWYIISMDHAQQFIKAGNYIQASQIFNNILVNFGGAISELTFITLGELGKCYDFQGKTENAIDCYMKALNIAEKIKVSSGNIITLQIDLANALASKGCYELAKKYYEQALHNKYNIRCEPIIKMQLGSLALELGDWKSAIDHYQTALTIFRGVNEKLSEAEVLHQLGIAYQNSGYWKESEQAYRDSAQIKESLGDITSAAITWHCLALLAEERDSLTAERWYRKAMKANSNNKIALSYNLHGLASLLKNQPQRLNEAQKLAEAALNIRKTLDESSTEIWKTYLVLAEIAGKQKNTMQAKVYYRFSRESYLRFIGMSNQMRQHTHWIKGAIVATLCPKQIEMKQIELLKQSLIQYSTGEWKYLSYAIQQIFNGERNEEVLLEPLNYRDAAIIHLILKGIENPESLETLFTT